MIPLFLLAGEVPAFLVEAAIIIVAAAVLAYVGYRLGLVPIVGFLLTGVAIGPNGLGLIQDQEMVDAAAEIGVILLLFTIGIEFSLQKLAKIQRLIFGGGGLQVSLATASTMGIIMLLGGTWQAGLFTGFLVALSSTAIVLKLLGDRGETSTAPGQVSLGLLIFQDLAIVVMVLLVPMLAGTGGSGLDVGWALVKAALMIAGVLLIARRVMPPLLEKVAKTCSQELFLLALVAICLGTAWLTSLAGLSLALGAFLAGLVVSESRFSEYAFGEIMPLQILFSATFFVSVGMLLDVSFLLSNLPLVFAIVAVVLIIKVVTTGVSALALGYSLPVAAGSALYLAQVGEFSFVLERAGRELGLFPGGTVEGGQAFIAATVVLMVLTPPLSALGARLARRLRPAAGPEPADPSPAVADEHAVDLEDHVILAGYGLAARRLSRVLTQAEVPHVVMTLSPRRAVEAEQAGLPVVRGDVARPQTLERAGLAKARLLVIAEDDAELAARITSLARTQRPGIDVLARATYEREAHELSEAGAALVITEEFEHVLGLYEAVLSAYHAGEQEVGIRRQRLRADGYRALLEDPAGLASDGAITDGVGDGAAEPTAPSVRPKVYGADWCPLTGGFRGYFKQHGIAYDYFNVEEDAEAEAAVRRMNGGKLKFPMVVVADEPMRNPDIAQLEAALRDHGLLTEGEGETV